MNCFSLMLLFLLVEMRVTESRATLADHGNGLTKRGVLRCLSDRFASPGCGVDLLRRAESADGSLYEFHVGLGSHGVIWLRIFRADSGHLVSESHSGDSDCIK